MTVQLILGFLHTTLKKISVASFASRGLVSHLLNILPFINYKLDWVVTAATHKMVANLRTKTEQEGTNNVPWNERRIRFRWMQRIKIGEIHNCLYLSQETRKEGGGGGGSFQVLNPFIFVSHSWVTTSSVLLPSFSCVSLCISAAHSSFPVCFSHSHPLTRKISCLSMHPNVCNILLSIYRACGMQCVLYVLESTSHLCNFVDLHLCRFFSVCDLCPEISIWIFSMCGIHFSNFVSFDISC